MVKGGSAKLSGLPLWRITTAADPCAPPQKGINARTPIINAPHSAERGSASQRQPDRINRHFMGYVQHRKRGMGLEHHGASGDHDSMPISAEFGSMPASVWAEERLWVAQRRRASPAQNS